MQTLLQVIQALEAIASREPAVGMIVRNDIFRLNATQDARYGVFAWTQREHRENLDNGILTVALTLFYVDRLTEDKHNELEVQSVGIATLGNILRQAEDLDIGVGEVRYNTFNQRFHDECAGVFCSVELQVSIDWICPVDYNEEENNPDLIV